MDATVCLLIGGIVGFFAGACFTLVIVLQALFAEVRRATAKEG